MRTIPVILAAALLAASPAPAVAQRSDTLHLSIEDAVTRMLRSSDEARTAWQLVQSSDAQVMSARAAGLPQIRLTSSYQQVLKNARAEMVSQIFGQKYTYNTTLNAQQAVFQGGRIFSAAMAANSVRGAARMDHAETRARLAVDVQRAYLNASYLARIAELQAQNLALASTRVAQTEQLHTAGRVARFDLLRARVERANLEPLALQAASDRDVALLEVRRLLDLPVEQPLVLVSVLEPKAVRSIADRATADGAPDAPRASVRAAELTARARRASVRVARADLLPQLNMAFNTGYLALPTLNGFPTVMGKVTADACPPGSVAGRTCQNNGWFADRNFSVTFSWNVFDGLRAKGNLDLAQAQAKISEITLSQVRETATLEVSRARNELARAIAAFGARQDNSAQAEEAYQLAELRYQKGLSTQLEVSDAQYALLTARSTEAKATYDLYLAVADLARVRGRDIPLPNGSTIPVRTDSRNALSGPLPAR
ncbi:MAG: TolC family protein [Gemmatimonadota bacterium]|nr:TolC family protein [Gemmatimonadota bacterium]